MPSCCAANCSSMSAITLARVAVAFALAMLIGSAIGIALGRSPVLDQIFGGWLVIGLNLPALVTIVLCYIWFGLTEAAAILAVTINKVPTVAAIVREGTKALDRSLFEMTQVFDVKPTRVLTRVILPQLGAQPDGGGARGPGADLEDRAGGGTARPAERRRVPDPHASSTSSTSPASSPTRWPSSAR